MSSVKPLGVTKITGLNAEFAQGVRAGPWLFLTGHHATDFETGVPAEVREDNVLPLHGKNPFRREGDFILQRFDALLRSEGSSLEYGVRLDQYYPTYKAVDPYHHARKANFPKMIPPSTSVLMEELLVGGTHIDTSLIATVPGQGLDPRQADADDVPVPLGSGFVPSLLAGDFVFIAGQMANNVAMTAIDETAAKPPKSLWGGTDIRLQTEFLITSRIQNGLKAAGSSLENCIKAQVYLTNMDDLPDFLAVWNKHFANNPCALTILPTSGLGFTEAIIEINILAVRDKGAVRKEILDHPQSEGMRYGPAAVKAGDLVCLSGLFAAAESAGNSDSLKYFGTPIVRQMRAILKAADDICQEAGTSLTNTVRAHHFFEELGVFGPAIGVWQEFTPGMPLPFGAVRVPQSKQASAASVTLDLWAYSPAA